MWRLPENDTDWDNKLAKYRSNVVPEQVNYSLIREMEKKQ